MKKALFIIFCLAAICCTNAFAGTPTLTLESKSATAGSAVKLALTLSNSGGQLTSVGTDISYDSNVFEYVSAEKGASASSAGKDIMANDLGGKITIGIFSMMNSNALNDGVVAYINFNVKSGAAGTASLVNTASGSNGDGDNVAITGNTAAISFDDEPPVDLPESVQTYLILTDKSVAFTIPYGDYVQVYGSAGVNTINVASGARADFRNFIGANVINIEDSSFDFTAYRSGSTVYLKSDKTGTLIKIPATSTSQTLNFEDKTLKLVISGSKVMLGTQEITTTETGL